LNRCRDLLHASVTSSGCVIGGCSSCVLLVFPALQSLEVHLGNSLVEGLALGGSDFQLLLGRLARAVTVLSQCQYGILR
jgi:hypothetical protein